jgi:hypothetical protein
MNPILLQICSEVASENFILVDVNDLYRACEDITQVLDTEKWETLLPIFCKRIEEDCELEEIEIILKELCEGINRENSIKPLYQILNQDNNKKHRKIRCKWNCLILLCQFDLLKNIVETCCDNDLEILSAISLIQK